MPNINPFMQGSADNGSIYVIGLALSDSDDGFVDVEFAMPDEMPDDGSEDYGDNTEILEIGDDGEFIVSPGNLSDFDEDPSDYDEEDY